MNKNIQELNEAEMKEINGGFLFLVGFVASAGSAAMAWGTVAGLAAVAYDGATSGYNAMHEMLN